MNVMITPPSFRGLLKELLTSHTDSMPRTSDFCISADPGYASRGMIPLSRLTNLRALIRWTGQCYRCIYDILISLAFGQHYLPWRRPMKGERGVETGVR